MNTNTNKGGDQDSVKALFKTFQQRRELASQKRQQAIIEKIHPGKTATLTNAETEDEQAVVDQYRSFMSERDGSRDEIIAQVTAYAKEKVGVEATEQDSMAKTVISDHHVSSLFQWPGRVLGRAADWASKAFLGGVGQWQLALPVLALVAVVLWLTQTVDYNSHDSQRVAWNNSLPASVGKNAQEVLRKLQPAAQPTLGFTQHSGELSAGFGLGQAMAYIELALAAQSEKHVLSMVKRADHLTEYLDLPLLSTQIDLQEDAVSLDGIAQRWFGESNELTAFYQLGHWMETAQFAMQLTELAEDLEPIIEQVTLLKERRSVWEKDLQQHSVQLRQLRKLADLDLTLLETHYGRQIFTRQLERTIAVFKNL
jgi:hypothetical protein